MNSLYYLDGVCNFVTENEKRSTNGGPRHSDINLSSSFSTFILLTKYELSEKSEILEFTCFGMTSKCLIVDWNVNEGINLSKTQEPRAQNIFDSLKGSQQILIRTLFHGLTKLKTKV